MHIEPGLIDTAKLSLSYATGSAAAAYGLKMTWDAARENGAMPLAVRSAAAAVLVFFFFEVLPHPPVGVSEVHLILGSMLFLLFGVAPAAVGLTLGLLAQGLTLAPNDLPQYGANLTTLLVPLFAVSALARKIIPAGTAYVDVTYRQTLALSTLYQAGIVAWVAFWAVYGRGFTGENVLSVVTFGAAYMTVILVEPIVDLGILAVAKALSGRYRFTVFLQGRVYQAANV